MGAAHPAEEGRTPVLRALDREVSSHLRAIPGRGERLIVRHVLIGTVFTLAGIVTLLIPSIPFICIGALIFGPIELMIGLFGNERRARAPAPPGIPAQAVPMGPPAKFCPSCGMKNDGAMNFCTNCGIRLT